jgi:hypothetical protein
MKHPETFLLADSKMTVQVKTAFFTLYLGSFLTDGAMERAWMSAICVSLQLLRFVGMVLFPHSHSCQLFLGHYPHQFFFG